MGRWDYRRIPELVADLERKGVDVIFTPGSKNARLVRELVKNTPIVAYTCDPFDFAVRLSRQGGNVTGVTCMTSELTGKRLKLLKEVVPTASRVVFMMGAVAGAAMWGCCGCCSSTTTVNVNKTVTNVNSSSNVYSNWSKTTVSSGSESATVYSGPNSKVVTNNQNNNVYATHDGNAYKKQDGQWEKWGGGGTGWQPVNMGSSETSTSQNLGSSQSGGQRGQQSSTQQPGTQQAGTTQSRASQASEQRGSQSPGGPERQSGQTGGFGPSSSRFGGSQGGGPGQEFGRSGGSEGGGFGQGVGRFGGQGLESESAARDRGFQRFSGARGGFGGFRR